MTGLMDGPIGIDIFEEDKPRRRRAKKPKKIVSKKVNRSLIKRITKPIVEFRPIQSVKQVKHPFTSAQKVKFILFVGGCVIPNCVVKQDLQVHHIIFQEKGGLNTEENAVVLCPNHHAEAGNVGISVAFLKAKSIASLQAIREQEGK